ncbi:MAG: Maf family nucleotide pyrophosphatase [Azonexus sp.]|nr:Maf family nucleotide pyrophosphatase [Azonexus sp.]
MRIYLASRSPRRRELLHQIGVNFETLLFRVGPRADPETDETPLAGETPLVYVERVARAKASHGGRLLALRHLPAAPVLSADTTLALDGDIIGKPDDAAHAAQILRRLSGREHQVLTGVAISDGVGQRYVCSVSTVRFRSLSDTEIDAYVRSGEPMDKAGAYGIQGKAGAFVAHIAGSYTGIMGLPLFETAEMLKDYGWRL